MRLAAPPYLSYVAQQLPIRADELRQASTTEFSRRRNFAPHDLTIAVAHLFPLNNASVITRTSAKSGKMGGVSVKDVDAQKFINSYAAFLKRQGKLPSTLIPTIHLAMPQHSRKVSIWLQGHIC